MKNNFFIQSVGCFAIGSLLTLSGCATNSANQSASAEVLVVAPETDNSSPAMPATLVGEPVIAQVKEEARKPDPEPEAGSVASVLKKMETSPYTLYWREKNTYSYYVGGMFDAEYKPGTGLVVKDESSDDTTLTCRYDGGGSLGEAAKDQKMKEACSKLMFTLDGELSD